MPTLTPNPMFYTAGLDLLRILASAASDFEWMLFTSSYTPASTHALVTADLNPAANELAVVGYARDTALAATRTVDPTNERIVYDHDDLVFGTTPADSAAEYAILIYRPALDATAIPVLCAQLDASTRELLPDVGLSSRGLARVTQAT